MSIQQNALHPSTGRLMLISAGAGLLLGTVLMRTFLPARGSKSSRAAAVVAAAPPAADSSVDPDPEPSPVHRPAANDHLPAELRPPERSADPVTPAPDSKTTSLAPLVRDEGKPRPTPLHEKAQEQRRRAWTADYAIEKRLAQTEDDLRQQLFRVPELRLVTDQEIQKLREEQPQLSRPGIRGSLRMKNFYPQNAKMHQVLRQRAVRAGLSLISEDRCRMNVVNALAAATISKELRALGFVSSTGGPSRITRKMGKRRPVKVLGPSIAQDSPEEAARTFKQWCDENGVEKGKGSLDTLVQMLQVEEEPTRLLLVRELARARSAASSRVLARRALMDLSPKVRRAAIAALKRRPGEEYQRFLLQGYTYPWAPVADHAAEALVTLDAKDVVPQLIDLLDQPDTTLPVLDRTTGRRSVRELVRLNHLRNCLLCHVPSSGPKDGLVQGAIPQQGNPLQGNYYHPAEEWVGNLVRADTTFLRQDFSVSMSLYGPGPRSCEQRFDFVVRRRILPAHEKPAIKDSVDEATPHEAVEYTLRRLTGKDGGCSSAKWRALLGIPIRKTPRPRG